MILDLGDTSFARGGYLRVKLALREVESLLVQGRDPELPLLLPAWARAEGHRLEGARLWRGGADRRTGAERAGAPDEVVEAPPRSWGFAARGALVEAGAPPLLDVLAEKDLLWTDDAGRIYAQAAAAQWDPAALDWACALDHEELVEDAIVQLMTYLVENETVALMVPARFAGRIHPHFREVIQVLAVQAADEARHIEVFTRRAGLRRPFPGLSTVGGQTSLHSLLLETDFALASFLLSVLGEGSFLVLLRFIAEHAPDPLTRQICRLAGVDEARHVAFGMAHLGRHLGQDPGLRPRLRAAIERRHEALRHSAGLNEEVFDALVLLAGGGLAGVEAGWAAVVAMKQEMDLGRRVRLEALGFPAEEAAALSGLHTRNFM